MWSDIITLSLAITGLIALLMLVVMKVVAWRTGQITVTIPLNGCDKSIFYKIYNIRSVFEFCGMKEKCTVVIINYGAPEWFCNEIIKFYEKYDFVKFTSPEALTDTIKELRT